MGELAKTGGGTVEREGDSSLLDPDSDQLQGHESLTFYRV